MSFGASGADADQLIDVCARHAANSEVDSRRHDPGRQPLRHLDQYFLATAEYA
jgi:hypothetical protein